MIRINNFAALIASIALALSVLLAGCAQQTEILVLDDKSDRTGVRFERLLVVAVTSSEDQQQVLEDSIVSNIRQRQASAFPSYELFAAHEGILLTDVKAAAIDVGADGILVARISSVDTTAKEVPGREFMVSSCRSGDFFDYFLYDREILKEADSIELSHTVVVVSELYDASSEERIWMIQSTCFDRESLRDALREEADAIVRQLDDDKLLARS